MPQSVVLRTLALALLCVLTIAPTRVHAAAAPSDGSLPFVPTPMLRASQIQSNSSQQAARPSNIVIPRLDVAPKIDEFVSYPANSSIARRMLRITNFIQRVPEDGSLPFEETTAYLAYTHDAFFAVFLCRDNAPKLIRAHMLARDSLADDDNVVLMLDTFHDQRRAFVFQSNPLGIQADALYSEQTGYDFSFDTVWDTWGRRTPWGYVVMMRIPFASMYFKDAAPGEMRTWGIILNRNISHTQESDYWPRSNHNIAGRLTQDQEISGFRDVEHGKNKQFEPYVMARNLRQLNTVDKSNPYFEHKGLQGYTGLDAKFILHNSLVLDATVNPDFSQVGIDNPAVPNQRFPPFFAEVRPFFIENSSYFQTPLSLYYTNNIVKPQFGTRLTGKLGRWAAGLLAVDDRGPGEAVPQNNPQYGKRAYTYIGRLDRDFGAQSNVGAIYADREYQGSFNRAGGIDYRMRVGNRWTVTGQGLASETTNLNNHTQGEQSCENYALSCSGQAWLQEVSYSDLHWNWWTAYSDTAAGFVTDTGFFQRPDIRQPNGRISYTFRPQTGRILAHGPRMYMERIWDHNGVPLDFYINPGYRVSFKRRTSIYASAEFGQDRLRPIDYPALKHDVEYHSQTLAASFYTSPVPWLALGGGYYQGNGINYNPPHGQGPGPVNVASPNMNLEVKGLHGFDLQNNYVFTRFTDPQTGTDVYDNHELISRWNYQMTKAASINLIGQYIATLPHPEFTNLENSKTLFGDALFTYMPHPGTALYVGYIGDFANLNRALCTHEQDGACDPNFPILPTTYSSLMNDGKTIYVKLSYLLRF